MNYIGSKKSLLAFIEHSVNEVAGPGPHTVCDLFAGTGAVGTHFKRLGHSVIANDLQYYSYALIRHFIGNSQPLEFAGLREEIPMLAQTPVEARAAVVLQHLNSLPGTNGFIYQNFCLAGTRGAEHERQYFSDENGQRCDAVRQNLETWRLRRALTEGEYYFCLASLLESIDKVANTASVYGAFLKQLKRSAQSPLIVAPLPLLSSTAEHTILNADANTVIREVEGDVLYLDPPYNQRQYAANYHVLETIARYDDPALHGKTGLREYSEQKSRYCSQKDVLNAFRDLIQHANFRYIFLSYNNEGLLSPEMVEEVMAERGEYGCFTQDYTRFRAAKDSEDRVYSGDHTVEYLHFVRVRQP